MKALTIAVAGVIISVSSIAGATPNFPTAMQQSLSLTSAPACALCHTDGDQGGLGTVNTPFGKSLRQRGLVAYDTTSLNAAITQMESDDVDSAGACLGDIAELKAGGDPNQAAPAGSCADGGNAPPPTTNAANGPTPAYGCGATIAPTRDAGNGVSALALLAILLSARAAAAHLRGDRAERAVERNAVLSRKK